MKPDCRLYCLIGALLLTTACSHLFSQTSYHITTSQGLATQQLTVLIKDRQNNMWFGSYNGVHKHEGTAVKVYHKSGKDSTSLSSNEVHAIFEDRLGYIWAGTTGGLDKLDPVTGAVRHYKVRSRISNNDNIGYIYTIFQDKKDNIWLTTDLGMFRIDYKTGNYSQVPRNEKSGRGLPETQLGYKSTYGAKDGIWMVANCRLVFYDYKTGQFFHRFNNPLHKAIFNTGVSVNWEAHSDLCKDKADNIYFISQNYYLVKYNTVSEKIDSFRFQLPDNSWNCCYAIALDYKGNVWIGLRYGGLLLFNSASHQFTTIRYKDINSLIASDYIYSLCEDYLNRMWVTTNNGIFIIDYYDTVVQQKYLSDETQITNINYEAGMISNDEKGNLYIPYFSGGLFRYNIHSGASRFLGINKSFGPQYTYVYTGDTGRLYVGVHKTMMQANMNLPRLNLTRINKSPYKELEKAPGSVAWVYKYNDRSVYFKKTGGNIYYYNGSKKLEQLTGTGFAKQACVSKNKRLFYFINESGNLVQRNLATLAMDTIELVSKLRDLNFLYANPKDVADDGQGHIWIASQNGLIKYNITTGGVVIYTTADGLLHDFTFTLYVDTNNRLWAGSLGGVNLYDAKRNIFINVYTLPPDKLSDPFGSSAGTPDGHIYFLFGGKLVNIDPAGFLVRQAKSRQLKLNAVEVNGAIAGNDALTNLSYKQNSLYFRFGLLEFAEPEKVKYAYQLQGFSDQWTDLGNISEITFRALLPGAYHLNIKATDVYGNEVKQMLAIPFTIQYPFWQRWWFKVLYLLLAGLLLYWFFKRKQSQINQQKDELEIEQAINYFSTVMHGQKNIEEMLWSVTKNCIGKLGFMDCVIYLMDEERNVLVQKAAYGPKNPKNYEIYNPVERAPGQGIVGSVAANGVGELIKDTSKDSRYLVDDEVRIAEIAVPIIYEGKVLGVIDSEHTRKNYFKEKHLAILTSIAAICAIKIAAILAEEKKQNALLQITEQKRQMAALEFKAFRAQMNPHFIFNALNSIQSFSLQNDFAKANKYLSRFSRLLRLVLQQPENGRITVANEIEMLEPYLEIEALRLGPLFSYGIEVDEELETEAIGIPSMIIQPFVENALKHGLSAKKGERSLQISFVLIDENYLRCTIQDNGVGRKKAEEITRSSKALIPHQSMGMKLVKERLSLLQDGHTRRVGIYITDLLQEDGESCGTKVEVIFPVE